jgi:proteasome lid subunit RPN8/RPN11
MLHLSARLRRRLEQRARAGYPDEACGLLVGRRAGAGVEITEVVETLNVSSDPRRRYEIDPVAYVDADDQACAQGLEIVGIWHSHPDHPARPSARDRAEAWEGWSYVIVSVQAERVSGLSSWRLASQGFVEEPVSDDPLEASSRSS